ncbi:hypothetical protein D3C87_2067640 [compost metagenome]
MEGQDVEGGVEPAQLELVVAVVEVGAEFVEHVQASSAASSAASCTSVNCSVMPSSLL